MKSAFVVWLFLRYYCLICSWFLHNLSTTFLCSPFFPSLSATRRQPTSSSSPRFFSSGPTPQKITATPSSQSLFPSSSFFTIFTSPPQSSSSILPVPSSRCTTMSSSVLLSGSTSSRQLSSSCGLSFLTGNTKNTKANPSSDPLLLHWCLYRCLWLGLFNHH